MDKHDLDHQAAIALSALASALCKQPGIDGQKLLHDFLDDLEGLAGAPEGVETVGKSMAGLMGSMLQLQAAERVANARKPQLGQ
jgi:hypothetical protein